MARTKKTAKPETKPKTKKAVKPETKKAEHIDESANKGGHHGVD